ncbi:hypothetical protein [Paraburkholderia heleia]|nr:hypothetical protein [Paraburkholderia heleia]
MINPPDAVRHSAEQGYTPGVANLYVHGRPGYLGRSFIDSAPASRGQPAVTVFYETAAWRRPTASSKPGAPRRIALGCQFPWLAARMLADHGESMKGYILLFGVSMLAACTSVTAVNSRQDGHLTVTSRARWDLVSWNHVRAAGLSEAEDYCEKQKKQLHTVEIHSEGLRGVTSQTVEVIFDCI